MYARNFLRALSMNLYQNTQFPSWRTNKSATNQTSDKIKFVWNEEE